MMRISPISFSFNSESEVKENAREVISYGGDTDTNACIVGAMAEAMYGIDSQIIEKAKKYIPTHFVKILDKEYTNNIIEMYK